MLCQTVKKDKECLFWSAGGCAQETGKCHIVDEKCEGCARVEEWPTGKYCATYAHPENQWDLGVCNMATHIKAEAAAEARFVNPLKASKRAGGRR
ncbi:MAG: hypothetical protein C0608_12055 [Deltaproteobacteria bacterium]|nr:MAG: hypothetical protein C0608_12055 [Deltaproteobacteria bacterium]